MTNTCCERCKCTCTNISGCTAKSCDTCPCHSVKPEECEHEPTGKWSVENGKSYAECKKCGKDYPTRLFEDKLPPQPTEKCPNCDMTGEISEEKCWSSVCKGKSVVHQAEEWENIVVEFARTVFECKDYGEVREKREKFIKYICSLLQEAKLDKHSK